MVSFYYDNHYDVPSKHFGDETLTLWKPIRPKDFGQRLHSFTVAYNTAFSYYFPIPRFSCMLCGEDFFQALKIIIIALL